jgi:hypothetical protein
MKLKKIIPIVVVIAIGLMLIKKKEKMIPKVNKLNDKLIMINETPEKTAEKIIFINKNLYTINE